MPDYKYPPSKAGGIYNLSNEMGCVKGFEMIVKSGLLWPVLFVFYAVPPVQTDG